MLTPLTYRYAPLASGVKQAEEYPLRYERRWAALWPEVVPRAAMRWACTPELSSPPASPPSPQLSFVSHYDLVEADDDLRRAGF